VLNAGTVRFAIRQRSKFGKNRKVFYKNSWTDGEEAMSQEVVEKSLRIHDSHAKVPGTPVADRILGVHRQEFLL
jgi:hypothetical protein